MALWHTPVMGSYKGGLWRTGATLVLPCKIKCSTKQFFDDAISRLICTNSRGHIEMNNLHLHMERVSQNDFAPVGYYACHIYLIFYFNISCFYLSDYFHVLN